MAHIPAAWVWFHLHVGKRKTITFEQGFAFQRRMQFCKKGASFFKFPNSNFIVGKKLKPNHPRFILKIIKGFFCYIDLKKTHQRFSCESSRFIKSEKKLIWSLKKKFLNKIKLKRKNNKKLKLTDSERNNSKKTFTEKINHLSDHLPMTPELVHPYE